MPTYSAPGVYVEETQAAAQVIEGVETSTAAFLGETERGPLRPVPVTSYGDYARRFGEACPDGSYMSVAVQGFFDNGGRRAFICRIVGADAATATCTIGDFTITAIGPGAWGNHVTVKIVESTRRHPVTGAPIGFRLQIAYWPLPAPATGYPDAFTAGSPAPSIREDFDNLVCDDPNSPDYVAKRLETVSGLVRLSWPADSAPAVPPVTTPVALTEGADGSPPSVADFQGQDTHSGLAALEDEACADVSLLNAPAAPADVTAAILAHCERSGFRFAVVDCAHDAVMPIPSWDSSYAAFYYPWLVIADPEGGPNRTVPPGGAVLGAYARTDIERGVWKAPANQNLHSVIGLTHDINASEQESLDQRVNAIRRFAGRGIRIWGARTLSSNSLFKYVSTRRLLLFLEHSIIRGTAWTVFEPNDERCWERVRDTVVAFLRTQWRAGALVGTTEKDAFTVRCDRSTMTADDILQGRLICEVGVAPVRPAEFVIFRVFQQTANA